nr:S-layer homology domain-containing protein [Paenibacillus sp. ATY16]
MGLADNGETSAFSDVKPGDWYVGVVAKALDYGIIEGYKDGTFEPNKTITREEAMVMIMRAMKLAGLNTSVSDAEAESVLSMYADGKKVTVWAKKAVAAAVESGLVQGSKTGLNPTSEITRAESAVIVQRLLEKAELIGSTK